MTLQNNDIVILHKNFTGLYEHLSRYLFTKIMNKTSIIITFSAIPIDNFILPELTASISNKHASTDSK